MTSGVFDKSQWLWVMWLDWLFSTSWLSCPPAPVSQTEEQYVSQQGCQTHPSQMLRGNMRVWPRENNSSPNPSSMTSRYKRLFLYSCLGFCGAVRIVFTILWLAEARCEGQYGVMWLKVVDWIVRLKVVSSLGNWSDLWICFQFISYRSANHISWENIGILQIGHFVLILYDLIHREKYDFKENMRVHL